MYTDMYDLQTIVSMGYTVTPQETDNITHVFGLIITVYSDKFCNPT